MDSTNGAAKNRKLEAAFYITPSSKQAMFFAGIQRPGKGGEKPEVSIITTEANKAMSMVHDRMPVVLTSENAARAWVQDSDKDSINELMEPASENALSFTEVTSYVNKSSNEGPECIEPKDPSLSA